VSCFTREKNPQFVGKEAQIHGYRGHPAHEDPADTTVDPISPDQTLSEDRGRDAKRGIPDGTPNGRPSFGSFSYRMPSIGIGSMFRADGLDQEKHARSVGPGGIPTPQ